MPRYRSRLFAAVAACALSMPCTAAAVNMQEGLWEITTKMEMPGMPPGMGDTTMQHCFTKQQAEDPRQTLPKDDQCTILDFRSSGDTVTWTVQCKGDQPMTGTGSMTYRGSSYDGTMTVRMTQDGQPMTMTQRFAGRRLGPCR